MKIVCDNCATKYSIADEKVRGKVFKIRCKKCEHVIVVRGGVQASGGSGEGAATTDASYDGEDQTAIAGGPPAAVAAAASADAVWHLVIDREQVGPMTVAEVRAKHAAGQIDAETYAWREGFGDWLRLGSIDEFKDLGAAKAAPEARTMINTDMPPEIAAIAAQRAAGEAAAHGARDMFAGQSAPADDAGDLFGGAGPTTVAPPSGEDPFAAAGAAPDFAAAAASAVPSLSGGGMSAGIASPASVPGESLGASFGDSNGAGSKLTGQRNENSVLFSLNNLQALANPKPAAPASGGADGARPGFASAKSEGSGLIDIRAMAQQTISAAPSPFDKVGSSEPPSLAGAPVFSPVLAPPVLMPTQQTGMPKWIWGVIGGGVLVIGGIAALMVIVLLRKPEPQQVVYMPQPGTVPAANVAGANPGTPGPAVAKVDTPAAKVDTPAPAGEGDKVASADRKKPGSTSRGSSRSDKGAKGGETPTATTPTPTTPTAVAVAKPKKPGGDTTLDDLLDGASPATKPTRTTRTVETGGDDANLPEQLSRDDIKKGMTGVQPKALACFQQYHVPGTALVSVMIAKSGKVQSADVKGVLAGTPTGDCVAKAVKSGAFGKFKGAPMSVTYPFILR